MKLRENNKLITALTIFLIITVLVLLSNGGVFGEEKIYMILGGMERNPILFSIAKILAFIGSPEFLIPVITITVITGFLKNKRDFTLGLTLASAGTYLINTIIKNVIRRPRPTEFMLAVEHSLSFPSGHAMTNTAIYLFLAYYVSTYIDNRRKKLYYTIAAIMSVLMSLSRVYLGVHYPTDVLAGFLGGYICFVGIIYFLKWLRVNPPHFM